MRVRDLVAALNTMPQDAEVKAPNDDRYHDVVLIPIRQLEHRQGPDGQDIVTFDTVWGSPIYLGETTEVDL